MKNLLVCLDTSPRAPHVLAAAIDLARRTQSKLTLFRSVGIPPKLAQDDIFGMTPNKILEKLLADAKKALSRFTEDIAPELLAGVEVRVGIPWDAICAEAKSLAVDVIVIGSHGYRGIDRVLGTTAAKVVNHAECSVFVVR